jgi:hypothetical protein
LPWILNFPRRHRVEDKPPQYSMTRRQCARGLLPGASAPCLNALDAQVVQRAARAHVMMGVCVGANQACQRQPDSRSGCAARIRNESQVRTSDLGWTAYRAHLADELRVDGASGRRPGEVGVAEARDRVQHVRMRQLLQRSAAASLQRNALQHRGQRSLCATQCPSRCLGSC